MKVYDPVCALTQDLRVGSWQDISRIMPRMYLHLGRTIAVFHLVASDLSGVTASLTSIFLGFRDIWHVSKLGSAAGSYFAVLAILRQRIQSLLLYLTSSWVGGSTPMNYFNPVCTLTLVFRWGHGQVISRRCWKSIASLNPSRGPAIS